jgi:hypothetical protein
MNQDELDRFVQMGLDINNLRNECDRLKNELNDAKNNLMLANLKVIDLKAWHDPIPEWVVWFFFHRAFNKREREYKRHYGGGRDE